jgi:hypothetical protein
MRATRRAYVAVVVIGLALGFVTGPYVWLVPA